MTAAIVWLILLATAPVAASTFTPGEVSPLGGVGESGFSQTTPSGGPPSQIAVSEAPPPGGAELSAAPSVG